MTVARFVPDCLPLTTNQKRKLPTIVVNGGLQMRELIEHARNAVLAANTPQKIFLNGGTLVRIVEVDGVPRQEPVDLPMIAGRLMNSANWMRKNEQGALVGTSPPRRVAENLIANPDVRLPRLRGVSPVPILSPTGRLLWSEGYDEESGMIYAPPEGLTLYAVSDVPSDDEVRDAVALLMDEVFGEFPFSKPSDVTHAVSLVITPFVRPYINGVAPVSLVVATTPGTGKGLLCDCVHLIFLGTSCPVSTIASDEGEARKRITALLLSGALIILIDNVTAVDSGQLAAVLTAPTWTDRLLGKTKQLVLKNNATWILTGNNVGLSAELVRRAIPIRIDAGVEKPWQRENFRHRDLRGWIRKNRAHLIWAVHTLIQNWIAKGRPRGTKSLGSFEEWAAVVGGILECAGISDFLGDRDDFYLYYLLNKATPVAQAQPVARRLCAFLGSDSVYSPATCPTLPGSISRKAHGHKVELLEMVEVRYTIDEIAAALDAVGAPQSKPTPSRPSRVGLPRAKASPLIPPVVSMERIEALWGALPGWAQTLVVDGWLSGGRYPSRSEADAAVVRALVNAGAEDEEIEWFFTTYSAGIGARYVERCGDYLERTIDFVRRTSPEDSFAFVDDIHHFGPGSRVVLDLDLYFGPHAATQFRTGVNSTSSAWPYLFRSIRCGCSRANVHRRNYVHSVRPDRARSSSSCRNRTAGTEARR